MIKLVKKVCGPLAQALNRMRLAQKLMLIYSVVLAVTILIFAGQLISVANNATEQAFLKDTQKLLKESKLDIENRMDICYRVISALSSDYDIMSYLKDWDKADKTTIFDFSMGLRKKFEQIRFLSPDVYQFRVFISNGNFPEIGSDIYSISRLKNANALLDELSQRPDGLWIPDHIEDNYNMGIIERKKVVSLYTLLKSSYEKNLGITEVTMPVNTFFRSVFSQPENRNLFAFAIDGKNNLIYDPQSGFLNRYKLDKGGLLSLFEGQYVRGGSGVAPIRIGNIKMNMVYDYVDKLGCSIFYIVTNENITSSLKNTTLLIMAESLLSLVVLSVLIYFLTKIIFKKMKQIIASMRKVEEGKFDIRVAISGQDEMNEMAYHFNRMLNKLGNLISEVIKKQEAKKNAEIRALFAQINSHFIINTLENIKMMAEVDCKYEVSDAITSLGKLLRYGLKWTSEYAMLKEELEYIKNYIDLVNLRYDFEIRLQLEIPPELMEYQVPKVSLQPVVENAVYRGIVPLARDGVLRIKAWTDEEYTLVEVMDNGAGMDEEHLDIVKQNIASDAALEAQGGGSGIGLRNVNERIRLVYGEGYGIDIASIKDEYTRVTMRLPNI